MRFFVTALTALTAMLVSPAFGQAPQPEGPFAIGPCKTGCVVYDTHPSTIFIGAVAKPYRVCSVDGYSVEVVTDIRLVKIAGGDCADVNGTNFTLKYGKARVGRMPD